MACPHYAECKFCAHDQECDHFGTGDPFCRDFQCTVEKCPRSTCISYEEEYDIYHP